ncbi:CD3324 family protein [Abyssisolibacter fermentans]|uniref:CD3324 family protein n=1 Tax=Abyssisolibacter fermentans TaxID=1766203 RepID=UPI00082FDE93|nr:CD3324 family protein [Abyssisolibacter fermentans]
MSYVKAENILPQEIIELIQKYVDGEYIYIPRKNSNRKAWGENTNTKNEIKIRNTTIYKKYINGITVEVLASEYYLSKKSIQRIILQEKRKLSD